MAEAQCFKFRHFPYSPFMLWSKYVSNPKDYDFVDYEWTYDEDHTIIVDGELIPRQKISKIILKHKHTGDKYIIDLLTEKGEIVSENKVQ